LVLLGTFLVMAVISVAIAVFAGLHGIFSLLVLFGILVVLLPVAWVIGLKLTAPRHPMLA